MTHPCNNSPKPLISVCIANYNSMEVIDDCLRSVLEQEGHIPGVKQIESPENVGFCISNNRMAAAARGQYLLLNNDAALYPDALKTLLAEADRLGKLAILAFPSSTPPAAIWWTSVAC